MNMKVDFKAVFAYLIPLQMRGERMAHWVGALLAPLQSLNDAFVSWSSAVRYDLSFNGQVGNLEHVLNDTYDPTLRRIYIEDPAGQFVFTTFLFNQAETQPTAIIYNKAESGATSVLRNYAEVYVAGGVDFVVKIPAVLNVGTTTTKMKSLINKYRQAGKTYIFETI